MNDTEIQKLLLEEKRMEKDYLIKEAKLALKRDKLHAKIKSEESLNRSKGLSPVVATILVAIFGLAGTGLGATLQGLFSVKLERQKFESTLISKAIESEDSSQRAQRLKFYTEIGLITDQSIILGLAIFSQAIQSRIYHRVISPLA